MVSKMFLADFKRMKSEGVELSPEDVIRLNALAVKARCGGVPPQPNRLRRVLFLGGVVLYEPTIGHDLWLERIGEYFDMSVRRNFRIAYTFAMSAKYAGMLPDPVFPRRVVRKMYSWARRHIETLVSAAVDDAIDYLLFGDDWTVGEFAPEKGGSKKDDPCMSGMQSYAVGVMRGCIARRLPLSLAEMRGRTCAELNALIARVDALDGRSDDGEMRNKALGDYFDARDEIIAREKRKAASNKELRNPDGEIRNGDDKDDLDKPRESVQNRGLDGLAVQPSASPGDLEQG